MQYTHTHTRPAKMGKQTKVKCSSQDIVKAIAQGRVRKKGAPSERGKCEEFVKQTLAQFISNLQTARTKANKK